MSDEVRSCVLWIEKAFGLKLNVFRSCVLQNKDAFGLMSGVFGLVSDKGSYVVQSNDYPWKWSINCCLFNLDTLSA